MSRRDADVIVIGGGIAGICAALELLERGRSVLMLDRDGPDQFGGLAKESFGGIWFADTPLQRKYKIRDSQELGLADWMSFAQFGDGDHWPMAWARTYVARCIPEIFDWLTGLGISFMPMPLWVERGLHVPGNSVPRWHIVWGTGHELATVLAARLRQHPRASLLEIRFGQKVEGLVTTDGAVTGCRGVGERDAAPFEYQAQSVIIAAGGINGSDRLVRENWQGEWSTPPDTILNGSHKYADGTLHQAARAAGARITHLDWQWNYAAGVRHWRPRKPRHGLSLVPPKSALWLDWRGERFGPMPLVTGFDTHDLVGRICSRERGYSWQVLNRRIALKELAISGGEFNPSFREKKRLAVLRDLLRGNRWLYDEFTANCPDVVVADTLPELVDRMNALVGDDSVDQDRVLQAVSRYDETIERGSRFHNDEQLRRIEFTRRWVGDRLRTCKFQKIADPAAGPLMAIREFIISRKSMGGIQTDLSSRVLDQAGDPLPGLYAVGEAAGFGGGGMNGKRGLEGTFLGGCIFSGRIAGREA